MTSTLKAALCLIAALTTPASLVLAQDSAMRWDFDSEAEVRLSARGNVRFEQAGPRPPEFPDMPAENQAIQLEAGAYLSVADEGPDSHFDFNNGDTITIEAWVSPSETPNGQPLYIIGKGRTGSPKFHPDNQNWALRIVGSQGDVRLSFLFATERSAGDQHWHRWTSKQTFPVATGWHHLAVSYTFGEPTSIRGWINGAPTEGTWDLGGATTLPPVVDDDQVRIGERYEGLLDGIAVHRAALDDATIAARFHRVGKPRVRRLQQERMPELGEIPEGRVLVQLGEGLPTEKRWLYEGESWPAEMLRWESDAFLLPRIPLRYDSWGIRTAWKAPVLLRMAADVDLPPGPHRFLLRARSLGRLWVDGELVASTLADTKQPPNGEEPITPLAEPPVPGARVRGYRQQEVFGETMIEPAGDDSQRRCRVVLELVVGGKNRRTETGEICVAVETQEGSSFAVLQPGVPSIAEMLPLTDEAVEPVLVSLEQSLTLLDDAVRREAASSQDEFWAKRHAIAREWAQANPAPVVPAAGNVAHPVDAFVTAKIQQAVASASQADSAQAKQFHNEVLPLLRENCFRCHGEKDKGGLKLNSRDAALLAGDSEVPAVVPGDPDGSELIARVRAGDMPPTEEGLSEQQIAVLEAWVRDGAPWPAPPLSQEEVTPAPVIGDAAFLRRIYLDTVGVPPTQEEAEQFLSDSSDDKRERLIDRLLDDERFADHWISEWLDLLAENPTLLNASLNSTGPFRWFLYESFRDRKPLDRLVTELLLMRGGSSEGGSAGFGVAAENDSPFAAKAHIAASAFLGIEMQCARCHDSPYHSTTQRDLYSLAAMLARKSLSVPATSRVPVAFFEKQDRESLIEVSLKVDEAVAAEWPFAAVTGVEDGPRVDRLMFNPKDSRERLAALITSPENERFPQVMVNLIWKRLIGAGLVEPAHDWEGNAASHPDLLAWLAHELVAHEYDMHHVIRLIVTSQTYQREATGVNAAADPQRRFFQAPDRRRLTAEQIVDSLHAATGHPIDVEELTFVHDGRRSLSNRLTLGKPRRAWMFGDLKNERDRPSLSLPRARAVVDVLEAFGWNGARQKPITHRETDPNVLQPGILSNGTLVMSLTRAAHETELAQLAVESTSPDALVEALFLRVLTRLPNSEEKAAFSQLLQDGFDSRLVPPEEIEPPQQLPPLPLVTWFNHLQHDANTIQQELERRVRQGPAPDPRLRATWRTKYEDAVWSLVNHSEFVWMP